MEVVGTDIDPNAIENAWRGVYGDWSLRGVKPENRDLWFEPEDRLWRVRNRFREGVSFHTANLLENPPHGPFDLAVCRNVLIYLTKEAQNRAVRNLARALRPGGYLMTGHNELINLSLEGLASRLLPEGLVYRREPAPPPPAVPKPERKRPAERKPPPPRLKERAPSPPARLSPSEKAWVLANAGRLEEAEKSLSEAIRRDPTDPVLHFLVGYIEIQEGRDPEARKHLQRALYLDPGFVPAYVEFAALYEREGNRRAAQRIRRGAADVLAGMPADTPIPPYEGVTARQLRVYLGRQSGGARGENG